VTKEVLLQQTKEVESAAAAAAEIKAEEDATGCSTPNDECSRSVYYAMETAIKSHPSWYPALSESSSFEDFQAHFALQGSGGCQCSKNKVKEMLAAKNNLLKVSGVADSDSEPGKRMVTEKCGQVSAKCEHAVKFAMETGFTAHPNWYPELTEKSTFEDFQEHFSKQKFPDCSCQLKEEHAQKAKDPTDVDFKQISADSDAAAEAAPKGRLSTWFR